MLQTSSIKILIEFGKHVALKAKGIAALLVATGLGATAVVAAQSLAETFNKTQE